MIEWLIKFKDGLTTILGFLAGAGQIIAFLIQFANSPDPSYGFLISGIFTIIIGWFTGKKPKS